MGPGINGIPGWRAVHESVVSCGSAKCGRLTWGGIAASKEGYGFSGFGGPPRSVGSRGREGKIQKSLSF